MTSQTKLVADMTQDELLALVRRAVQEALWEYEQEFDPDEGLEFRPEFAEQLRAYLRDRPKGKPADEVMRRLGLDVSTTQDHEHVSD
jgi:hypothetical protein